MSGARTAKSCKWTSSLTPRCLSSRGIQGNECCQKIARWPAVRSRPTSSACWVLALFLRRSSPFAASSPARARKAPSARRPNCLSAGKSQATKASRETCKAASMRRPTRQQSNLSATKKTAAVPTCIHRTRVGDAPMLTVHALFAAQRITCQMPVRTVCKGNARRSVPQDCRSTPEATAKESVMPAVAQNFFRQQAPRKKPLTAAPPANTQEGRWKMEMKM